MNPLFDLSNKNILLTGGGSGIGQAIAKVLAAQGAFVIIFDYNHEAAQGTVEEIIKSNGKAVAYNVDVTDAEAVASTIQALEADRPIDILINNAGIGQIGMAHTTSPEDFDKIYNINVKGYYHMIHTILPYMMGRKKGNIINIASVSGSVGIAERFAYTVTKGAVLAMTRSVAKDYIKFGILCNSISPGRVHTPFVDGYLTKTYPGREKEVFDQLAKTQPIGRMGEPDEIAYFALYLCADQSSFATGTDYPIDGGFITLNS